MPSAVRSVRPALAAMSRGRTPRVVGDVQQHRVWPVRKLQFATPANHCRSIPEIYCQFLVADVA
jgi:hypothetical protein